MARILVVDDEQDILALIRNALMLDEHYVEIVNHPKEALKIDLKSFDLILLDIMMDEMDGFTLCEAIRDDVDCPIIFLSAKVMESDITYGLGIGADDYLVKPFKTSELRARIIAHLRRDRREKKSVLKFQNIIFDLKKKEVIINDDRLNLTKGEYLICEFLARNQGQVFSKEQIIEKVFGYLSDSDPASITEHIKNIRAKFSVFNQAPIKTVWGIGYQWI